MSGWVWAQRQVKTGLLVTAYGYEHGQALTGPGCHCRIITGAGNFLIQGIRVRDTTDPAKNKITHRGASLPASQDELYSDPFRQAPIIHHPDLQAGTQGLLGPDVTDALIVDMMYEAQAKRFTNVTYGAIIFSDRVNRGSKISPAPLGKFGTANMSMAGFAKYLNDHPEFGTLFSSPIFHNPNHTRSTDWSLCQVWTWFAKSRENRLYVDEADSIGIGPDTNKFKKKTVLEEYIKDTNATTVTEADLKITYDVPQQNNAA